jgi:hypothetical protein
VDVALDHLAAGGEGMNSRTPLTITRGALGGLLAGAAVIAWFLVFDLVRGQPLATPSALAGALLAERIAQPTLGVILGYTVLHLGVFAMLGAAAATALVNTGIRPGLRHGVVFGVGVLNAVHYGALLTVGADVMTLLPAWHVVMANLVGGVLFASYLHVAERDGGAFGWSWLREQPTITQGLITGAQGAVAVAICFLILDIAAGRPFYTPAALGSALFLGGASPGEVEVTLGLIGAYTGVHLAAFGAVGIAFQWASEKVEHTPGLWLLTLMAFIVLEAGFLGSAGLFWNWAMGALGWWAVIVGNVIAVAVMGHRVWRTHPGLREKLVGRPVTTMV